MQALVPTSVQLGDPVEHRGIVIAPLFTRRDPVADYVTLDDAAVLGLRIEEVSAAGTVPELRVVNPLDRRVLLYDGEELAGAKQNRILDVSVLVERQATVAIPVSCVEQGRWHAEAPGFRPAPQAAHPQLRRRKAEAKAAAPLARGAAQRVVWDEVASQQARLRVDSPTGASADTFLAHRHDLDLLQEAFPAVPGQAGALLALGDTLCLDWVSRPDAFARLWPKLRRGYLLDALERLDGPSAPREALARFVDALAAAATARQPSAGLGDDLRLAGEGLVGSGLALDGELVQVSAYSAERRGQARIARPARRR